MLRLIMQTVLAVTVVVAPVAAQTTRMWYRGPFDGWVDVRPDPAPGYYYQPSPNTTYPLNESAYGQPIPCPKCGHMHYASQDVCPYCGAKCSGGGNNVPQSTVYTQQPLPGQYWYEEQPHYRFVSPMRLGWPYQKYNQPWDPTN